MQILNAITANEYTQSVCPTCLQTIDAKIVIKDNLVYLQKECSEHGPFSVCIWPDAKHYHWMKSFRFPFNPLKSQQPSKKGCPQDCGLCSSHLRHATLVEIEVTDSCNMKCPVCFMSADTTVRQAINPNLEDLEKQYTKIMEKTSPLTSIQLTGGEPSTRRDLAEIVRSGRKVGFQAIEINSNGIVIANDLEYLIELANAGASGIYLQFDGLEDAIYEKTRGKDLLKSKLKALDNCRKAGIQVVLAMTVIYGINHHRLGDVLEFALENNDVVAGIALQPAFVSGRFEVTAGRRLSMGDVIFMLAKQSKGLIQPYDLWPLGCAHPLCDSGTYLLEKEGIYEPITRRITPEDFSSHFDPDSPQGSVFTDIADKMFPESQRGLSIIIMNFMDAMTMDLKRLKECSMVVSKPDGSFVPFCSYQLNPLDCEE
ncbi:radical SAM protein [Desulfosporosinus shakirovi]|uniref:radical SAM protein n=1 Tax=Desulfosporosinus shakirovi TaxID=2885154 RepID=UPI001E31512F|nr:radical SAM protein [Desulfosporosinus sp. SRJS8]MCB8814815.1 radical SAM protein [Desulfosporosinus sp. SRJS8]